MHTSVTHYIDDVGEEVLGCALWGAGESQRPLDLIPVLRRQLRQ